MKRIHLLLCFIGCTVLSIAQNGIATLSLAHIEETHIQQSTVIQSDTVLALNYPGTITGLSISGTATLNHASNSLVRVTLQDDYNTEWLVYELFPLLADSSTVTFSNVAFETSVLENITAKQLNIKIINATLQLDGINTSNQAVASYSTLQNRAMEAQSSYIIDKLNENLEKRNIPWRAGETSVSRKTYEEKKAMFGGEVPNLGGFEYYKGGIFVMPDYELASNDGIATMSATEEEDPYVKEWDWRNRHGKNWMTPVKDQGLCGSCWAFSAIGALESYINIYYNQLINIDLSEQELVSCVSIDNPDTTDKNEGGCGGGKTFYAYSYIKYNGVMLETDFPYSIYTYIGTSNGNCEEKPTNPSEKIKIGGYDHLYCALTNLTPNELKSRLFNSPQVIGITNWDHALTAVGYKAIEVGDELFIKLPSRDDSITIQENDPLIGTTAWLLKNSWGEDWGDNGYGYVVAEWDSTEVTSITGNIESLIYSNNDIHITDNDDDGYFTWGFGERPTSLPFWANYKQDGDDNNADYGAIDEYGNLIENISGSDYYISGTNTYTNDNFFNYGFVVLENGALVIKANIKMHKDATITVKSGGRLIVDGGTIHRGNIVLEEGASLEIRNGGQINLQSADNVNALLGSTILIENGAINTN